MKRLTEADIIKMDWLSLREKQELLMSECLKGTVYVIESEGHPYCKIGVTGGDPQKRLVSFQIGSPFKLSIIVEIYSPDCQHLEELLHERFENKRVRGEWFNLTDEDIDELKKYENQELYPCI